MAKDLLTREELNLLLSDESAPPSAIPPAELGRGALFSPADFATLQRVFESYLSPGVTAWSVLFNRSIELGQPEISLVQPDVIRETGSAVVAHVEFFQGLKGHARFVLPMPGARVLVGLALGTAEVPTRFDAIHRSSFASVLKYLLAEMRTLVLRATGKRSGTSDPEVQIAPGEVDLPPENLVQARLPWSVDGTPQDALLVWCDLALTQSLLTLEAELERARRPAVSTGLVQPRPRSDGVGVLARVRGEGRVPATGPVTNEETPPLGVVQRPAREVPAAPAGPAAAAPAAEARGPQCARPARLARVAEAHRPEAAPGPQAAGQTAHATPSLSLAEETEIRVELGRALVRDAVRLGQVVPLDRVAGESVDLFVDGQLVARGEVTTAGETVAVRITQIVVGRRPAKNPSPSGGRS